MLPNNYSAFIALLCIFVEMTTGQRFQYPQNFEYGRMVYGVPESLESVARQRNFPQCKKDEQVLCNRIPILTPHAPQPVGAYSQAIRVGNRVYLAGSIPYDPYRNQVIKGSIEAQADSTFRNLKAMCEAAGGTLDDVVKLTVFITDFADFPTINKVMTRYFNEPYPARATVGVAKLWMDVALEIEGIMEITARQPAHK